jgi:hypothetical protein
MGWLAVLASTAHVQIVFQLSYTAAAVMTRYTGAGCAAEKRGEEKQGSFSLSLSLSLSLFVFLLQGELPYGFRASFSSGLHGFQTNISLWRIWWGFGCPFHHQCVVQLLLCYTVICCGGGGNWVQKYLFLDCAWLSVLNLEIEQTSGFARVARVLKICPFISFIPFSSNWGTNADENSLQAMEDPRHRRQVIWHLTDWIELNSNASVY